MDIYEEPKEKLKTSFECSKKHYEKICGNKICCSELDKECLYRKEIPDSEGRYRCMKLDNLG